MNKINKNNVLYKSQIFKNAYYIYHAGDVKVMDSSINCIYYSVIDPKSKKEHVVVLKFDPRTGTTGVDCDCTLQSLKIKEKPLCSHILATMMHAGFQLGRPGRKKK